MSKTVLYAYGPGFVSLALWAPDLLCRHTEKQTARITSQAEWWSSRVYCLQAKLLEEPN